MERFHEIRPGECFASVCKLYGFEETDTLYNHPRNAELKRLRPNPYVLNPGDRVFVPENELREVDAPTEQCHVFRLKASPVYLRLVVQDLEGEPCCLKPFELRVGAETRSGCTDSTGFIKERINARAEDAELTVWFDAANAGRFYKWNLKVGHLDPVEEITGVQARLNNLGYFCGAADGAVGEKTAAGIRAFQREHDLPETGEIDAALRAKLLELHQC